MRTTPNAYGSPSCIHGEANWRRCKHCQAVLAYSRPRSAAIIAGMMAETESKEESPVVGASPAKRAPLDVEAVAAARHRARAAALAGIQRGREAEAARRRARATHSTESLRALISETTGAMSREMPPTPNVDRGGL